MSILESYDYHVPKELIATEGAQPRESARLMVFRRDSGRLELGHFSDLSTYLGPQTVLVFNETKVIPARIVARDPEVEITITDIRDGEIQTLSSRRIEIGGSVFCAGSELKVVRREGKCTYYATGKSVADMKAFLIAHGETPLPPYIKNSPLTKDQISERYQTVFAKHEGSVAAPTAALHFSESLLQSLKDRGVTLEFITLHVGLGTFLPVTEEQIAKGELHTEEYFIDPAVAARITAAKKDGKHILAVGTTSLRTLESASSEAGELVQLSGKTNLFIRPGYAFKIVDGLITNFHVPQSSLLMLVDAFLGSHPWRKLYERAIAEKFRLFSFGDGMLIL